MALVNTGIGNAGELGIMQLLDSRSTAVAHTRTQTTNHLVDNLLNGSFVRHTTSDSLWNKFLDILGVGLEVTILRTMLHSLERTHTTIALELTSVIDNLGDFITKLKATPQWRNLLIVLVADHGINYKNIDEQQPLLRNHIPLLWLGGAIKEPRTITALCNQTDICATLLGQMNLPHDDFRFSRDVLSASYVHPTAVHNYSNVQLLIDSTGYVLYDFDASHITKSQCTDQERLLRLNKAILQTTINDLKKR